VGLEQRNCEERGDVGADGIKKCGSNDLRGQEELRLELAMADFFVVGEFRKAWVEAGYESGEVKRGGGFTCGIDEVDGFYDDLVDVCPCGLEGELWDGVAGWA